MRKFALIALLMLVACTRDNTAIRAVEAQGMTDVHTTGYRVFGCSEDDDFHTGFEAKDSRGRKVTGVVCSGWLKGATVRID